MQPVTASPERVAGSPLHEAAPIFAPNPQHNHGSSIVETPDGDLLACWFHGSGERTADDVVVQGARKRRGESDWCDPFVMADTQDLPDCNPVLFVDPAGRLWLFWIAVQHNDWGGSLLKYRTAMSYGEDGPPKWDWQDVIHCRPKNLETMFLETVDVAKEKYAALLAQSDEYQSLIEEVTAKAHDKLARRLGWMTRVHPIMTSENRMMLGLYSDVFNCSLAAFTENAGKTWTFSEPILTWEIGNIQPSFVRKKDGAIVAMMRDNGMPKRIRIAESTDDGITWGPVGHMKIPNPGSSVECIALDNGHWVLVCNDTSNGRNIISAYLSEDEGATWPVSRRLEDFERDAGSGSYPSVIQAADRSIHATYSFKSKAFSGSTIKHVRFNEAWIRAGTE